MCSCAKGARWEKEALEQGLGNSFKPKKKKKTKAKKEKVSKTLLAKALANTTDTDASYCFISDLAAQLDNISPRLSKSIITAIERAEGVRLNYALIDKVLYNSLHNILSFIFDNVKLPQIKNALTAQIFESAYQFKN
ncbi:hypothetical protein Kyoto69B_08470 [Helicobacter pylori]